MPLRFPLFCLCFAVLFSVSFVGAQAQTQLIRYNRPPAGYTFIYARLANPDNFPYATLDAANGEGAQWDFTTLTNGAAAFDTVRYYGTDELDLSAYRVYFPTAVSFYQVTTSSDAGRRIDFYGVTNGGYRLKHYGWVNEFGFKPEIVVLEAPVLKLILPLSIASDTVDNPYFGSQPDDSIGIIGAEQLRMVAVGSLNLFKQYNSVALLRFDQTQTDSILGDTVTKLKQKMVRQEFYNADSTLWWLPLLQVNRTTNLSTGATVATVMVLTNKQDTKRDFDGRLGQSLNAYPNPARDQLTVSFLTQTPQAAKLRLINSLGQTVLSQNTNNVLGEKTETISLNGLAAGVYLLQLEADGERVQKMISVD